MIADLKPYPSMKNSGVLWLGDVPAHWEVRRLKQVCRLAYGDALATDVRQDGPIPVFGSNGHVGFHNSANTKSPCIVIGRKGSFGKVNYSRDPVFAIDTTFFVDSRFSSAHIRWLYFLLGWLRLDEVSKDSAVPGLDREDAYQKLAAFPPLPEQAAIVRYLDHADRRIRRYIHAKQKLVKLLEEQKQALIHRAVTRGLDPNVRLKPSGAEWLGDVPEHWEVVALRYVATKFGSGVTPRGGATMYEVTGIPFLRSQNIHFDGIHLEGVVRIPQDLHDTLAGTHVKPGDVLLNITGASIGRVCSVPDNFEEGNVNQHVCIIRPKRRRVLPGFLAAFLSTPFMQREIRFEQNGASREGLTLHSIRGFKVALPTAAEQQHILDEIRGQTGQLAVATATAQGEVDLLREYRTRLIADVVTGKLDVREAAARLPDEDEEPEPLDETDALTDGKEEPSGGLDATPEEAAV